jgi:AraC family transcriptional regulator of adaptative response / DNA-3-methyladenine glycosylase II
MNIYSIARTTKDRNFDGQFYFGVKTTGIFCRPSCPCPIAKEENVLYFKSVDEAKDNGFRACKRCQPDIFVEHYQNNLEGIGLVSKALTMIKSNYLIHHTLEELASALHLSLRHLRTLFVENIGTTPIKIAMMQRALYSISLLDSDKTITQLALESGFGSTRQFNDVFKKTFGTTPSEAKKDAGFELGKIILNLPYDDAFDFYKVLEFLPHRLTRGVERIHNESYSRSYRLNDSYGYFTVRDLVGHLEIELYTKDISDCYEVYQRMAGLFDLKTEFGPILSRFKDDPILSKGLLEGQIPRLPKAFNAFELTIRAIINQQISIKATSTFMERLVKKSNKITPGYFPEGITHFFPTPKELSETVYDDIGLTRTRQKTISNVVTALLEGDVVLTVNQSFDDFRTAFIKVKGIGDWTINYVALRALGMVDSFPAKDLGVIKALKTKNEKELNGIAEKWRPYRGYATLCLWHIKEE